MKCKFCVWLASLDRCLMANNLAKRGWPHNSICHVCRTHKESVIHLLMNCSFSKRVLHEVSAWLDFNNAVQGGPFLDLLDWWWSSLQVIPSVLHSDWNSFVIMFSWMIRNEKNDKIFRGLGQSVQ